MLLKIGRIHDLENEANAYIDIDTRRWIKIKFLLKYPLAKIVFFFFVILLQFFFSYRFWGVFLVFLGRSAILPFSLPLSWQVSY